MFDLTGFRAVVTGGANSLGADIVRGLAGAGAGVAILDVDAVAGEGLAMALACGQDGPGRVRFFQADVTDDVQMQQAVQRIGEDFGGLDFVVNNACSYADAGMASTRAQWLHSWNVNVVSGALLVQHVRPLLRASANASVVNLSSVAGKIAQQGRALYPACKAALLQLTRSEAIALAPEGIRVNAITPAWTWSAAMQAQAGGDRPFADQVAASLHPLGRAGDGVDVANGVLFLCSPASRFITGIDLPIDGGYSSLGPDQGRSPAYWFAAARQALDCRGDGGA